MLAVLAFADIRGPYGGKGGAERNVADLVRHGAAAMGPFGIRTCGRNPDRLRHHRLRRERVRVGFGPDLGGQGILPDALQDDFLLAAGRQCRHQGQRPASGVKLHRHRSSLPFLPARPAFAAGAPIMPRPARRPVQQSTEIRGGASPPAHPRPA